MKNLIFLFLYFFALNSQSASLQFNQLIFQKDGHPIHFRVGTQTPEGVIHGDIIYVHGFGDRIENHGPLFNGWVEAGFRVISFDLPSHGQSDSSNTLNHFNFHELADLVVQVEQHTKEDPSRPLILTGWSTGGLILVRALQEAWTDGLSRPIRGVILYSPGVAVRKFPWTFGDRWGNVTDPSLSHNPALPHADKPKPSSPFWSSLVFKFSPRLVLESLNSQKKNLPLSIPTLIFTGGDQADTYVKPWVVRQWIKKQNTIRAAKGFFPIKNISCLQSKHEIDNEPDQFGGDDVRRSSALFVRALVENKTEKFDAEVEFLKACRFN